MLATHVDPHSLVILHAHACPHCKMQRQRFIPSWIQGRLQLSGGEHSPQQQHNKEQSTLITRPQRNTGILCAKWFFLAVVSLPSYACCRFNNPYYTVRKCYLTILRSYLLCLIILIWYVFNHMQMTQMSIRNI